MTWENYKKRVKRLKEFNISNSINYDGMAMIVRDVINEKIDNEDILNMIIFLKSRGLHNVVDRISKDCTSHD